MHSLLLLLLCHAVVPAATYLNTNHTSLNTSTQTSRPRTSHPSSAHNGLLHFLAAASSPISSSSSLSLASSPPPSSAAGHITVVSSPSPPPPNTAPSSRRPAVAQISAASSNANASTIASPITTSSLSSPSGRFGINRAFPTTTNALFNISTGPGVLFNAAITSDAAYSSLLSSCAGPYKNYRASAFSAFVNKASSFNVTYTRPPECSSILQSNCLIWVDGVDLLYWPTPYATASPNANITRPHQVPASAIPDDFTKYPSATDSAYLVYKNARAILPYNSDSTTTGPFFTSLTVPYPKESLSSFYDCATSGVIWPASAINYEDFNRPPKWSVVSQQRPCHLWSLEGDSLQHQTFPPSEIATQYTDYVNKPLVVLPAPLTDINPAWASCSMGDTGIGLYDPPRAIQPAGAMAPPIPSSPLTTAAALGPSAVLETTAQPASGVSSTAPARTSVVVQLPNGDTVVDYPPKGASVPAPSQTGRASSGNGGNFANRPLPFDPNAAASPEAQGPRSGNAGQPEQVVSAGSGSSAISMQAPAVAVGGHTVQAAPSGGIAIDGVKLNAATKVATIGGAQVSLHGSGIIIGGNTLPVPQLGAEQSAAPIYLNHHKLQISTGSSGAQLVVDDQALPAGTSQARVGGNLVSVLNDGQISVVPTLLHYVAVPGPSISVFPNTAGVDVGQKTIKPIPTAPPRLGVVVAGQTLTPIGKGGIAVDGTTLSIPGQHLTLKDGTVVSLENGALVVGSQTLPIPQATQAVNYQSNASVVDGQTLTRVGSDGITINGTTVSKPGQSLTLTDGAVIAPGRGGPVVGTQTMTTSSPPQAIGYWVNKALGGGQTQIMTDGKIVYDGVTIAEGGPAVTLSNGDVVALEANSAGAGSSPTSNKGTAVPMASTPAIAGNAPDMETSAAAAAAGTTLAGGQGASSATQDGTQKSAAIRASSTRVLAWAMLAIGATVLIIAG